MQIVWDRAENAAHGDWMRTTPNAYEWWYCDAISDDGVWSLVTIFLLGNPFSPYYRLCAQDRREDPVSHNAVFFALHKHGALHHYLFARYPKESVTASETLPLHLDFGPNSWRSTPLSDQITLCEENANRRFLQGTITLTAPRAAAPVPDASKLAKMTGEAEPNAEHFWLPALPSAHADVDLTINMPAVSREPERIQFTGRGYHDHNWGTLPFDKTIRDWTWGRADFGSGVAALLYTLEFTDHPVRSYLIIYENGIPVLYNENAVLIIHRRGRNLFGTSYLREFEARSGDVHVRWKLAQSLESVPFYLRSRAEATLTRAGKILSGVGMTEYFRPAGMAGAVTAAAMGRRIYDPIAKT